MYCMYKERCLQEQEDAASLNYCNMIADAAMDD